MRYRYELLPILLSVLRFVLMSLAVCNCLFWLITDSSCFKPWSSTQPITFKIIDQSPTFPQKWNYNMIKEFLPYKIKRLVLRCCRCKRGSTLFNFLSIGNLTGRSGSRYLCKFCLSGLNGDFGYHMIWKNSLPNFEKMRDRSKDTLKGFFHGGNGLEHYMHQSRMGFLQPTKIYLKLNFKN